MSNLEFTSGNQNNKLARVQLMRVWHSIIILCWHISLDEGDWVLTELKILRGLQHVAVTCSVQNGWQGVVPIDIFFFAHDPSCSCFVCNIFTANSEKVLSGFLFVCHDLRDVCISCLYDKLYFWAPFKFIKTLIENFCWHLFLKSVGWSRYIIIFIEWGVQFSGLHVPPQMPDFLLGLWMVP